MKCPFCSHLENRVIDSRLSREGDVTRVGMAEEPTHGPGAWVHNPVLDMVLSRRMDECLDRLRRRCVYRPIASLEGK